MELIRSFISTGVQENEMKAVLLSYLPSPSCWQIAPRRERHLSCRDLLKAKKCFSSFFIRLKQPSCSVMIYLIPPTEHPIPVSRKRTQKASVSFFFVLCHHRKTTERSPLGSKFNYWGFLALYFPFTLCSWNQLWVSQMFGIPRIIILACM